jgi:hypothetical protein
MGKPFGPTQTGGQAPQALTLRAAADAWFIAKASQKKSAYTFALRLKMLAALCAMDTPVDQIDTAFVDDIMRRRLAMPAKHGRGTGKDESGRPLPPRAIARTTANRDVLAMLQPILKFARLRMGATGAGLHVAWADLHEPEPPGHAQEISAAQLAQVRAALPGHWHGPFDFAARYGGRLQEIFFPASAVKGTTINTVEVFHAAADRKRPTNQTIPILPEDALDLLARAARARTLPCGGVSGIWMRETTSGPKALTKRGFQQAMRTALDACDLKHIVAVHALRHTAATQLLRGSGGNLKAVQKLLGHKSITTTARYAHVDTEDLRAALRHTHGTQTEIATNKVKKIKGL